MWIKSFGMIGLFPTGVDTMLAKVQGVGFSIKKNRVEDGEYEKPVK